MTTQGLHPSPPATRAAALLRSGAWDEGLAAIDAWVAEGGAPDGDLRLLAAIARVRAGHDPVSALSADTIREGDPIAIRRLLATPLAQEGRADEAIAALSAVIAAVPPAAEERHQRAALLARKGEWDAAIADVDAIADAHPADRAGIDPTAARLQYRLRANRLAEAAQIARAVRPGDADARTQALMMMALVRGGEAEAAADLAEALVPGQVTDPGLASHAVQALFRTERHATAISMGEALLKAGLDSPLLRSQLAQAWYAGGPPGERFARAIAHLEAGVAQAPQDLRMVSLLGQLLLRTGKTQAAIPHLRQSVAMAPHMVDLRMLLARALKQIGDYAGAADEYAHLVANSPDGAARWQRFAAGAMAQAGRREEAADLFDTWVAQRARALPESFGEGLDALWGRVDEVNIPQARLDWAWRLRSPDYPHDRAEFDRRARWGHLADHYLLDWLECRDAQVEEAMHHFSDELDRVEEFCTEARARAPGKGAIFTSAHVGAMYFGPLALELVGERSRWIASTPSVARTSYAETLISTSDQTDAQVARAFMQALRQDNIVVVVVDGAINLAAPRIQFEGQEITFSEFAARTAHRMGSPTAFVAPVWRDDNRLGFVLEHLPMPEPGEDADAYAARWRMAYLGHLRAFLATKPENLRLSGGIWRHIR